jgi:glyoxylase-like metal-dependent hydrolase (beta-lactamase superfamily II)
MTAGRLRAEAQGMLKRFLFLLGFGWVLYALAAATETAGIHLIHGVTVAGAQPDGNSVILDGPQGLIVFDTGRHAAHTQEVIDFAKAAGKPVLAIINSHWHLDHVGGNLMLRAEYPDVRVYASSALEAALGGFLARYRDQLEQAIAHAEKDPQAQASMRAEIALIDAGPRLAPTDIVTESGVHVIAGRELELHLERAAVTAGDLWVVDRKSRTLLAGDLVTLPAPFLDTACPPRWQAALAELSRANFKRLIPGHGAPLDRHGLATYRRAFDALLRCAASQREKGECVDGWLRDADSIIPESDRGYARSLLDYYMDQVLRGHEDKLAQLCAS